MRRILVLLLFLTFLVTDLAVAKPLELKKDFSSINGVIIMPVKDQFLIDLDSASGVSQGDIFTLIKEGEKVIHPVTKEILGSLDVPTGYVQVTQVKTGYSYVKLLQSTVQPHKGDRIKRFDQVPATIDATVPTELKNQIRSDLPQFNWTTEKPLIVFSIIDNILTATTIDGSTIKDYPIAENSPELAPAPTPTAAIEQAPAPADPFTIQSQQRENRSVLNSTVNSMLDTIGLGNSNSRLEAPGIIYSNQQNSNVWTSTPFPGEPCGVTVGDFDKDNQQEIALVVDNELHMVRITSNNIQELETYSVNNATTILGIDSIDVDNDGYPEIIINSVHDSHKLNSQIIQFAGNNFISLATKLPWYLRAINLPETGRVLLGQQLGLPDSPFAGPITQFTWNKNGLTAGSPLKVPSGTTIFSLNAFSSQAGQHLYTAISNQDKLRIFSEKGASLWESGDIFGGSETSFYARAEQHDEMLPLTFVQPKSEVINGTTILVAQNDGSRLMQRFRSYDPSRIVALSWDGAMMKELWHTINQPAYLADIAVADADNDGKVELVTLVRFKDSDVISKTESNLVLYQLDKN